MKKCIVCLVLMAVAAFSQTFPTDKGSLIVGGSVSFTSSSGDLYENPQGKGSTEISLAPFADYFVSPGLAVGGSVIFYKESQGDNSQTTIGLGPEVRYFFGGNVKPKMIKGKNYPYAIGSFLWENTKHKSTMYAKTSVPSGSPNFEYKTTFTSISLGAGILHMLTGSVGVSAQVTYNMDKSKYEDGEAVKGNKIKFWVGITAFKY
jgi:hypothetical protein